MQENEASALGPRGRSGTRIEALRDREVALTGCRNEIGLDQQLVAQIVSETHLWHGGPEDDPGTVTAGLTTSSQE